MQKIISLFQRNYDGDRLVRDEVVPGAEWVVAGEGVATRKLDGTCCMVRGGVLYKRYDVKRGKTTPANFEPAQDPDPVTGHWPGWVPVSATDPADAWHRAAFFGDEPDGSYELLGPKVQGNADNLYPEHRLWRHGCIELADVPRDFAGLRAYFVEHVIEGIVWYHPDGRMVKCKRRDFGLPWPVK